MIYKFVVLFIAIHYFQACSPAPGWQPATLQEQVDKAAVIVSGTVQNVQMSGYKAIVTLNSTLYYKGCISGTTVTIAGFHDSASCGPGVPTVGQQIIAFACSDSTGTAQLELNDFTLHTGYVQYTTTSINTVTSLTGSTGMQCRASQSIGRCKKRIDIKPIDPIFVVEKPIKIPKPDPPRPDWIINRPEIINRPSWSYRSPFY